MRVFDCVRKRSDSFPSGGTGPTNSYYAAAEWLTGRTLRVTGFVPDFADHLLLGWLKAVISNLKVSGYGVTKAAALAVHARLSRMDEYRFHVDERGR